MNKLMNYFNLVSNEGKIAHSFLIGNTSFRSIENELNDIINKFLIDTNVNIRNNPDIYILTNEEDNISKDDIKEILNIIGTTSQFSSKKIYIIDECEKLNSSANNTILKTLEEPPENVYAFLITKNMEKVQSTIQSRCQKLFISTDEEEEPSDECVEIGNELFEIIQEGNISAIYEHSEMYSNITSRDILMEVLNYVQRKYFDILEKNISNSNSDKDVDLIAKKIIIINENINRLKYYLNKNISIDRLLIDLWRCEQ